MPFLIVGLGNPGDEYANTRHNFGFRILEKMMEKLNATMEDPKFDAKIWTARREGDKIIMIQPQTYMNLSGKAVSACLHYRKIPIKNLVVVHDDLDIPFGEIRVSRDASAAGHNGVQSIIDSLGTQDFTRVRLGIGRPPENVPADKFVLQRFKGEEKEKLPSITEKAIETIEHLIITRQS